MTQLLATALLAGVASVFFQTAYQVFLPSLVTGQGLPSANARLQASEAVAQVGGPGLAGLLAQAAGAVTGLVLDAVSFAVSGGCLLAIRGTLDHERTPAMRLAYGPRLSKGCGWSPSDGYLRTFTAFGAASNLALIGYQSTLVVFLVRNLRRPPGRRRAADLRDECRRGARSSRGERRRPSVGNGPRAAAQ